MDIQSLDLDDMTIETHVEQIEVTSNLPERDPNWVHVDESGHEHRYGPNTTEPPTLRWVVDEPGGVFVDPDGYPEEYPDEGHYECILCTEHVQPGMRGPSPFRRFINGHRTVIVNGEVLTPDEIETLRRRIASRSGE